MESNVFKAAFATLSKARKALEALAKANMSSAGAATATEQGAVVQTTVHGQDAIAQEVADLAELQETVAQDWFHNCSEVEERDATRAEKLVEAGMLADEVSAVEADDGDCRDSDDEYDGL